MAVDRRVLVERQALAEHGFVPWRWLQSSCGDCSVAFVPRHPELRSAEVDGFLRTIENEKANLLRLYGSDSQEYNLLAHMAIGILGRESRFFKSTRYRLKETLPGLVRIVKTMKAYLEGDWDGPSKSSRGPTQIKVVPQKIAEHYGVRPETLRRPDHAAVATMGFLIETLQELKRRVVLNGLDFVNETNYADYLPYLYFGSRGQLLRGEATPDRNIYIQDMRRYMSWVEVYEGPVSTWNQSLH